MPFFTLGDEELGAPVAPGARLIQRQQDIAAFGDPMKAYYLGTEFGRSTTWGAVWDAQAKTGLMGGMVNIAYRAMVTDPAENWNAFEYIRKSGMSADPRVQRMIDAGQFDGSYSEDQFWYDYHQGLEFMQDMETLSNSTRFQFWSTLGIQMLPELYLASKGVNILPFDVAANALSKIKTASTLANVLRWGAGGAGMGLAYKNAMNAINPLSNEPGVEDELAAVAMGAAFGSTIGLLTSPAAKNAGLRVLSHRKMAQLNRLFEDSLVAPAIRQVDDAGAVVEGGMVRSVVDDYERGVTRLKDILDSEPVDPMVISDILHRPGDEASDLLGAVQKKYKKAGMTLHVTPHPDQWYYDIVSDMQRLVEFKPLSAEATGADFGYNPIDRLAGRLMSAYADPQSSVTPGGRLARSGVQVVNDLYRTLSGSAQTIQVGSAIDPFHFDVGAAAENIKAVVVRATDNAALDIRNIYRSAMRGAEQVTYDGQTLSGVGKLGQFREFVGDYMFRQEARAAGWNVPEAAGVHPAIKQAADRARAVYLKMRNDLEISGMLKVGPRALRTAKGELESIAQDAANAKLAATSARAKAQTERQLRRVARLEKKAALVEQKSLEKAEEVEHIAAAVKRQESYFSHVYDVPKILNDRQGFIDDMARSLRNADERKPARLIPEVAARLDPQQLERVIAERQGTPLLPFADEQLSSRPPRTRAPKKAPKTEAEAFASRIEGITPKDLTPDLAMAYEQELGAFYRGVAKSIHDHLTNPVARHGVATAAVSDPLQARILDLDPTVMRKWLVSDIEQVLGRYTQTVGGQMAVRRAIQLNPSSWKGATLLDGKTAIETGDHLIQYMDELVKTASDFAAIADKQSGTDAATKIARSIRKSLKRDIAMPLQILMGRSIEKGAQGMWAPWTFAARAGVKLSYLNKLGSVLWAQMNDFAPITLYMLQNPRTLGTIPAAILHLKSLPRRELEVLGLTNDGMIRVEAIAGTDLHGGLTGALGAVDRALDKAGEIHGKFSLMTWITNVNKSAAGSLALDRIQSHSARLLVAADLMKDGMTEGAALRAAGLKPYDAGVINKLGFNVRRAAKWHKLVYEHGLLVDDTPIKEAMSFSEYLKLKAPVKQNFDAWDMMDDATKNLFDIVGSNINGMVNRNMVVTPGVFDRPLVNLHPLGQVFNQFQTFGMAFVNQRLRVMAQMPAGRQLWYGMSYFFLGAVSDAISASLSGKRSLDDTARLWKENPLGMSYVAFERSGLAGWLGRPLAISSAMQMPWSPGIALADVNSASYHVQPGKELTYLGPAVSDLSRLMNVGADVLGGRARTSTAYQAWKLTPYQNLLWLRMLHRATGLPVVPESLLDRKKLGPPRP